MAEVLKKFGRYFLLDQIAQGGMAEIYRARMASPDGAGRLIVIKRIQAGYGNNTEFLQMFRSEIKVTMGFNHPNIVQLYDFGEEQGQPYIAMELVDGMNLRQFMNRFAEMKVAFPVDLAVYIIEQAASGLHYAHTYKDKISGNPLRIVHRDVSPQNILISYEGNIKVIDFGIAKANTNSESTRAGVIKGKPSYLSPEQISGVPLDGRSDIFALGVVLWELLVGHKLFSGANDLAVLKMIESAQTYVKPPSSQNPAVPKELDQIVMKALAKQSEKRYQTAEELQRALHRFLYSFSPEFNPTDLAYSAKDMFKSEIVEDRKKIQRLNEEVEKLLICSELVVQSRTHKFEDETRTRTQVDSEHTKHSSTLLEANKKVLQTSARDAFGTELGIEKVDPVAIEGAKAGPRSLGGKLATQTGSYQTGSYRTTSKVFELNKKKGWLDRIAYATAIVIVISYFGPNFGLKIPFLSDLVSGGSGSARGLSSESSQIAVSDPGNKMVRLHLNIQPQGSSTTATVNGKPVNMADPVVVVPLDSPLELVVQNPSYKTVQRQFVVDSVQLGGQKDWNMDINLDPTRYGFLSLRSTPPADVTVMINGSTWKKRTPFEKEKFPVGSYTVKMTNDLLEMDRTLVVEIKEGEVTQPYDPDREASHEVKLNMNSRIPSSTKN